MLVVATATLSMAAGIRGCFLRKAKLEAGLCYNQMYGTSCLFLPMPHLLKASQHIKHDSIGSFHT